MGAEDLGKRLLAEVEEVGLDEILNSLRLDSPSRTSCFGLPALDTLLQTALEGKPTRPTTPIIELLSPNPSDGKTHLLYHLAALAILPTDVGGKQASVILIDADNKFSIPRLVQQMTLVLKSHQEDAITTALKHIHVLSPQSMPSLIATIQSLPSYLFNANRHHSFDRAIAFIALDSASAFYWKTKSDAENASLDRSAPAPGGYMQLAGALKNASRILNTPVLFTSWNFGPIKKTPGYGQDVRAFRPSLPPPWQNLPVLRLVVRRMAVRKLPVEIGLQEALRESEMRRKVVEKGMFECFVNEWGMDDRAMRRYQAEGDAGFEFRIVKEGVVFDEVD